jgi:hypothetical protein
VAVLVLAALLAPMVAPVAGGDLWGWMPDHGHASLGGVLGAHSHPWDADTAHGDEAATDDWVATAGDLLGVPAVPVTTLALIVVPALAAHAVPVRAEVRAHALLHALEPPPPR